MPSPPARRSGVCKSVASSPSDVRGGARPLIFYIVDAPDGLSWNTLGPSLGWAWPPWPLKCAHACLIVMTRTTREPHARTTQHHVLHTERFIVPPPPWGIERYRDPSVCLSHGAAALGYRHAGCLQLSHRRPAEMCGLPESSEGGRRSAVSRTGVGGGGHIVSPPPRDDNSFSMLRVRTIR